MSVTADAVLVLAPGSTAEQPILSQSCEPASYWVRRRRAALTPSLSGDSPNN